MFPVVSLQKLLTLYALLHVTFSMQTSTRIVDEEMNTAGPTHKLTSTDDLKQPPVLAPTVVDETHENTTPGELVAFKLPTTSWASISHKPMTSANSVMSKDYSLSGSNPIVTKSAPVEGSRLNDKTTPTTTSSDKNSIDKVQAPDATIGFQDPTTSSHAVISEQTTTDEGTSSSSADNFSGKATPTATKALDGKATPSAPSTNERTTPSLTTIANEKITPLPTINKEKTFSTINNEKTIPSTTTVAHGKTTPSLTTIANEGTTSFTTNAMEKTTPSSAISLSKSTNSVSAGSSKERTTPYTTHKRPTSQVSDRPSTHSNSPSSPRLQSVMDMLITQQEMLLQLKEHMVQVNYRLDMQQASIDQHEQVLGKLVWDVGELKETQTRTTSDVYTLSSSLNELRAETARKLNVEENGAGLSTLSDDVSILQAKVQVIEDTQNEMSNVLHHVISQESWLTVNGKDQSNATSDESYQSPVVLEAGILSNQSGLELDFVENVVSETAAQELEERTNHLLTSLDRWTRVEQILHVSLSDLHTSQRRHDGEIAYLSNYTLNNARVISQLANARIDDGRSILSLMNSTNWLSQQVYALKSAIIQHGNTTDQLVARNEHNIGQLLQLIELNSMKITALQDAVRGQGSLVESQLNYTVTQLQLLERSLNDFKTKFNTSHGTLTERVMANKQRSDMLWSRFRILDNRLAHVEVKYLTGELNKYEKTNEELRQQIKLMEVEEELETVKSNVEIQQTNHESLHRRLSGLESSLRTITSSVNELGTSWTEFTGKLPLLEGLYNEVQTMINVLPADCDDVYDKGVYKSGVQLAKPGVSHTAVKLLCNTDMDKGRGWTVVQHRDSGKLNFNKNWTEYKSGFGSVEAGGEFWMGNELLHVLTSNNNYSIHIDMWTVNNTYYHAEYQQFAVSSEAEGYSLQVSGYSGNATDSLRHSDGMSFSTIDVDNDVSSTHCAQFYTAGWWYRHCHYCNLNGRYTVGMVWFNHVVDEWMELKKTTMMISRRKQTTVPS